MQQKRIELYAIRTFSDKLTATFGFISENGKLLFKFLIYLLLPLSMIQALCTNAFMNTALLGAVSNIDAIDDAGVAPLVASYLTLVLAGTVGCILSSSLVYGLMRLYNEREERLAGLTFHEFVPTLKRGMWRALKMVALLIVAILLCIVLVVLAGVAFKPLLVPLVIVAYIAFLACLFPLLLALPIYIMEDISAFAALAKAFRLGFKTWGGIFAVSLILGLITSFLTGACSLPWYIMLMVRSIFTVSDSASGAGMVASPVYSVIMYLFGILQAFAMYVGYALVYIGLGVQYGHAAEKIDGVSVARDVDNFEALVDRNEDDSKLFE